MDANDPCFAELVDALVRERAAALAALFPERIASLAIAGAEGSITATLVAAGSGRELEILSENREATICFACAHAHCTANSADELPGVRDGVMRIACDIVSGRRVAYAAWRGELALGGGFIASDIDAKGLVARFRDADRFALIGWEPSLDRDVVLPPRPSAPG